MPAPRDRRQPPRGPARPLVVRPGLPASGRLTQGGLMTVWAGNPERGHRRPEDRDNPNYGPDGKRHEEDERKPRYKVELLARTFFGDVGARPTTDPNLVFWESPDIWIDGPSGDPDQATPGVHNDVKVHVWNVGLADCWAAHVDLYWCDPLVGISPALATVLGSNVITLMGGEHKIVSFPWVPSMSNDGHECLVAQVYDPVSDPIVSPFSPTLDRHVAQRNISVVSANAGKSFQVLVNLHNLTAASATAQLSVELLSGNEREQFLHTIGVPEWKSLGRAPAPVLMPLTRRKIPPDERSLERATGALRECLDPEPSRPVRRRVAGALQALAAPRTRAGQAVRAMSMGAWEIAERDDFAAESSPKLRARGHARGATPMLNVDAPGRSVVQFAVQGRVPAEARPEARDVYRVIERMNGRVTGGVTVIIKTPPRETRKANQSPQKRQK